jgi:hypothetical protein
VLAPRLPTALLSSADSLAITAESWSDTRVILPRDLQAVAFTDLLGRRQVHGRNIHLRQLADAWPPAALTLND